MIWRHTAANHRHCPPSSSTARLPRRGGLFVSLPCCCYGAAMRTTQPTSLAPFFYRLPPPLPHHKEFVAAAVVVEEEYHGRPSAHRGAANSTSPLPFDRAGGAAGSKKHVLLLLLPAAWRCFGSWEQGGEGVEPSPLPSAATISSCGGKGSLEPSSYYGRGRGSRWGEKTTAEGRR